jgi:methylmalonyl-CoA mutase cobalamin-binding domain/chain
MKIFGSVRGERLNARTGGVLMSIEILEGLKKSIIEGNANESTAMTKKAIHSGIPAKQILEGLVAGILTVGKLFADGEYYLPELLMSGEAMKATLAQIEPLLVKDKSAHVGKFLIGSVQGDAHDIGKNIVIMMLKGSGWEVTDLGVDVSPEQFCSNVKEGNYDILGMCALLTSTINSAAITIEALKNAGLRNKVKIMVGGAAITQEYADMIGADAYGGDAGEAVVKALELIKKTS